MLLVDSNQCSVTKTKAIVSLFFWLGTYQNNETFTEYHKTSDWGIRLHKMYWVWAVWKFCIQFQIKLQAWSILRFYGIHFVDNAKGYYLLVFSLFVPYPVMLLRLAGITKAKINSSKYYFTSNGVRLLKGQWTRTSWHTLSDSCRLNNLLTKLELSNLSGFGYFWLFIFFYF